MGIFTSREDAECFIAGDPFTTEGLAEPRILDWNAVRFESARQHPTAEQEGM